MVAASSRGGPILERLLTASLSLSLPLSLSLFFCSSTSMNEDRVVPRCKSVYRCRDRYRRRFARILLSLMQQRNCLLPRTRSRSSRYTILQRLSAVLYRHDSRAFIDERFFLERDAPASRTSQGDNRLKWLFPTEETLTDIFYVQRTRSLWSNRAFVFFGSFQSYPKIDRRYDLEKYYF